MAAIIKYDIEAKDPKSTVQREAVRAGLNAFISKQADRAKFIMACGTGKTFTQMKLAEALLEANRNTNPSVHRTNRILVLVPSLALVRQAQEDWAEQHNWRDKYSRLCVCSDKSTKKDADHVVLSGDERELLGLSRVVESSKSSLDQDVERINNWIDIHEATSANAVSGLDPFPRTHVTS